MKLYTYKPPIVIILVVAIACTLAGIQGIISNAAAQPLMQSPPQDNLQQPSANLTASISIIPMLVEAMKTKIKVSLNGAITDAMNSVGENSTAVLASIQPERGFLVYRVIVVDNNNNVHMILLDPANGDILSKQQLPAQILGGLISDLPSQSTG